MLCERAQELFSDYHEGAVKPAMLVPLESHLDECADCRTQMEGMRSVWTMLDNAPVIDPPHGFRAAVWAKIDAAEAEKSLTKRPAFAFDWRSLFRPATLGWAAAALVVLMLAPVVIPGAHSVARMWFPWSLFYGEPAKSHVILSQPQVNVKDGRKWVDVQVSNTGSASARLEVKIDGATSAPVVIDAPAGSNQWYHVAPAPAGTAHIQATWQEGGTAMSQEYTVNTISQ